jgi:hypothetical protein
MEQAYPKRKGLPDWKPSENKFKCPCHGSGYESEGGNFEGPAPRPMDRAHIERSPEGQILVDVSPLYQWPKGQPRQFNDVRVICVLPEPLTVRRETG